MECLKFSLSHGALGQSTFCEKSTEKDLKHPYLTFPKLKQKAARGPHLKVNALMNKVKSSQSCSLLNGFHNWRNSSKSQSPAHTGEKDLCGSSLFSPEVESFAVY